MFPVQFLGLLALAGVLVAWNFIRLAWQAHQNHPDKITVMNVWRTEDGELTDGDQSI